MALEFARRSLRFIWDQTKTEYENYIDLDVEHVGAYFGCSDGSKKTCLETESDPLLPFLKEQKFDIGIGGVNMADSFLFRALGIPYIKLSPEDIESHTMNFKFGMPVLLSAYPSSMAYSRFSYDMLPELNSERYRVQMLRSYLPSNLFLRAWYHSRLRAAVPVELRAEVVDKYD